MTAWTLQAESRETAENDYCRHSHTCDKSSVPSAATVTALLQGKPACKQENSGTKQVKTTPKWLRGLKGWKQQVNFYGCKKLQRCSSEKLCIRNKRMNTSRADFQLITATKKSLGNLHCGCTQACSNKKRVWHPAQIVSHLNQNLQLLICSPSLRTFWVGLWTW